MNNTEATEIAGRPGPTLVVDIGGTKIAAGLVTPDGQLDLIRHLPTEAQQGGEALILRVITLIETLRQAAKAKNQDSVAVGLGTAVFVHPHTGVVTFSTSALPGWQGMSVRQRVEQALELPTFVDNDVHMMALGEATDGAGQGYRHLLGLTVGTGVGGGVVIGGRLYQGTWGSAGVAGHLIIDYQGRRRCPCGRYGCLEAYASAPAIVAGFTGRVGKRVMRQEFGLDPRGIELRDIARMAQQGHPEAMAIIRRGAGFLGVGIAAMLNLLNPELVVIGGGVAQIGSLYFTTVRHTVQERALSYVAETPILPALLGPQANLIGAVHLAWQSLETGRSDGQLGK
ncbi:MAG: ROK family protein [Proteobacteria bacterium]|nr:ROK family protein [Pseudomonadota bacterium]